jgi:RecA/RadA recombinase
MISRCLRAAADVGVSAGITSSAPATKSWFNADGFLKELKRINIFCGGFGSGKTEVAVNFSLRMRELGRKVSIADLDIVNLYFRSREVRNQLRSCGIEVIVPSGALVNADLPIIVPEIKGAIEGQSSKDALSDRGRRGQGRMTNEARNPNEGRASEGESPMSNVQCRPLVVLDLGGDPAGARVMASIAEAMRPEDYSGLFVLNSRRPFTATVASAQEMMAGISDAARIKVDRIVVNSHLIDETTPAVIDEGIALGEELAQKTGARIAFVAVQRALLDRFDAAGCGYPVMVLDRLMLKPWEPSNWLGKYRIRSD